MARLILRRVLELVLVLLLVTFATFMLMELIPGDPAAAILGPGHPREDYIALHKELGLDEPVMSRYFEWLGNAVTGDLGESVVPPGGEVVSRVAAALPISIQLAVMGMVIALGVAVPLALWSAAKPDGRVDRLLSGATFGLVSIPSFLVGLLLILFLVKLWPVLPRAEWVRITSSAGLGENLKHAILPALVVAAPVLPVFARVLRSDLIDTMEQDFILAARARGMSSRRVLVRDALRPSSFSLITLAGVSFGILIGSTVIAEFLFGLPGMGSMIVSSATTKDLPLLQGAVVVIAVIYVLVNALVDLSYAWLDPRVRRAGV